MTLRRTIILIASVAFCAAVVLLFTGPRMKVQPNVRTYSAPMLLPPEGVVPVFATGAPAVPTVEEAAGMRNPLEPTAENIARGRTYYGYYCLACHGERGDGAGPVGQAYLPTIADFRAQKIRQKSDGQIYREILAGVGHAPVLEYTIPAEHRWPIVLFVRTFASPASSAEESPK